jgi:hypothetical protein
MKPNRIVQIGSLHLWLSAGAGLACVAAAGAQSTGDPTGQSEATTRPADDLPTPPDLSDDLAIWPNRVSHRNSDEWLWRNHERIRKMRPRVIVLNFANDVEMDAVRTHVETIVHATAEATRYHGFENPDAPAFIEYDVVKYVDLRDREGPEAGKRTTSTRFPRKSDRKAGEVLCDYAQFYTDEFARHFGFRDPRDPQRYLNLHELINAGFVHEMWFYAIHDKGDQWPGAETLELKQFYDENCRPIPGKHGHAGNGKDRTMPWSGRSFCIAFFNPHRGPGCSMENFGHTLEWIANSRSVLYYRRYFYEYAELNLDERFGLPFSELYDTDYANKEAVTYPEKTKMVVQVKDETYTIDPYIAFGGNVHFPPGARHHYDLESPYTVLSTIETYRRGPMDLEHRRQRAKEFNIERIKVVGDVAPDCMGNWTVFWRQCMPGLDNPCLDDDGEPMKNWWVFLFY